MKNSRLRVFFLAVLSFICCPNAHGQNFSIGKYDTLHSDVFKRNRRILVHLPTGYNNSVRYPVLYLLDGESHFTKTIGIIDHLSRTAGNELCPEMIVVAIFHPNREQDLIPATSGNESDVQDKFPEFLKNELIPYVDGHYPTTPYRVFVGHSLGGLRVINTLVYQPQLFNAYIALDPSLGMVPNWIGKANAKLSESNYSGRSLYIAMGLTMPKWMDTAAIFRDTSSNARHMRCIMSFARNAENAPHCGLDFSWKYYPEETHQSVVFKGTYDGLIADFHWFKNEKLYDVFKDDVKADSAVKIITDYYKFLSTKMGYIIPAPEQGTSELIDYLTFKKWYDKALAFAILNLQNYPTSKAAKAQLQSAKWNTKKDIATLYPLRSAKEIYSLAKKEILKTEPDYNLSEEAINVFGYLLMQQDKLADAEVVFKLNVELYPDSYNVYDSYGECLLLMGKQMEGLKAYTRSLELNNNNTNARNIITKYAKSAH